MRWIYVIIGAVLLWLSFLIGARVESKRYHITTEYQTDTLYLRDTITIDNPVPVETIVTKELETIIYDTMYVVLPREMKIYENESYRAVVSGIRPSLDEIKVFPQEKVVTNTITETITHTVTVPSKAKKFGIGVQVGYGLNNEFKPSPYIGVGLSYNILTF